MNFQSIISVFFEPKPNDFNCGVNDSDFKFYPIVGPTVRQRSTAIVEIGLFYDQSFYDLHSNNLQDFLKTVLRQIQIIFEYPSMNPHIRLVVTRLIKIESYEVPKQPFIDSYVKNFCDFQYNKYWKYNRDYDLALFFSQTLFYSEFEINFINSCYASTSGLAKVDSSGGYFQNRSRKGARAQHFPSRVGGVLLLDGGEGIFATSPLESNLAIPGQFNSFLKHKTILNIN